ncbi:DUF5017 domain-containing protein [Mucilaginibacter aquatilis]|uniref:DUF5017 domain-containing protein n=1 Tax=Mucilaginibacter aquatilis TaxID=1517760 RepID=A0A6I4IBY7_9SPHI|nr:DUF5017 domain-containing protein [Mucilaginibacter aquatilis]MVN92721.1 DUF5017 domain-containing protein [Mucilaginibacter aquatilis]
MKIIKNILPLLLLVGLFTACTKEDASTPDFDVSVSSASNFKAGQPVIFSFNGNPDVITFYSGEANRKYENRNRNSVEGKATLQFSSFAQNSGAQLNSLTVLASNDFKGAYNVDGIKAATWTDITSRAVLSTGADNVASGVIDVSDVAPNGKPVYFAFKKRDENSALLKPRAWTIRSFSVDYQTTDNSTFNVATLANAGWAAVDVLNPTYKWNASATALTIGGGNINTPENEDWIITKVLYPNAINPDRGTGVKSVDARLDSYPYTFNTPGNYHVVFVASNVRLKGAKEVVKEMDITIVN